MKLMSLEEAQARSLSPNHPVHRERQRENSLPNTSTATLYHTVIDISDSKYDRFMFSPLRDDVSTLFVLRSEQSVESLCLKGESFLGNPRNGSPSLTWEGLWKGEN